MLQGLKNKVEDICNRLLNGLILFSNFLHLQELVIVLGWMEIKIGISVFYSTCLDNCHKNFFILFIHVPKY